MAQLEGPGQWQIASTVCCKPEIASGRPGGSGLADTVYVANHGGDIGHPNTIEQFTSTGVGSVFANTGSLNYPTGLAFDSFGNLYATIDVQPPVGTGSIVKFTPGGVDSVLERRIE